MKLHTSRSIREIRRDGESPQPPAVTTSDDEVKSVSGGTGVSTISLIVVATLAAAAAAAEVIAIPTVIRRATTESSSNASLSGATENVSSQKPFFAQLHADKKTFEIQGHCLPNHEGNLPRQVAFKFISLDDPRETYLRRESVESPSGNFTISGSFRTPLQKGYTWIALDPATEQPLTHEEGTRIGFSHNSGEIHVR